MAKPIYEMGIDELVEYLNTETKTYNEVVLRDEQIPGNHYFDRARFNDEALFNLYFACDVIFSSLLGAQSIEKLEDESVTLRMYEPLQVEFRKRLGHPDPYGASTVIQM